LADLARKNLEMWGEMQAATREAFGGGTRSGSPAGEDQEPANDANRSRPTRKTPDSRKKGK
jgi:hypothetical protein